MISLFLKQGDSSNGCTEKTIFFAIIDKKVSPQLLCGSMKFLPIGKILLSPFFEWAVNLFSLTPRWCSPTSMFKVFLHICRGGPVCPPASEMILEFANMSSKLTFLQWNH